MATRYLTSIQGNSQKLDGGAMFGNAPKALWTRWIEPDEQNRIPLCCRALLIEENHRRILLETGIGAFFEPKLKDRFGIVEPDHVLLNSLAEHGLTDADIDVVVLSHLHFDHVGGLLTPYQKDVEPQLLFPNATFIVSEAGWQRAQAPHFRDRASFIPEIQSLLASSGRLVRIPKEDITCSLLGPGYRFHLSEGHTPGLMLTEIDMPAGPVVFGGDLIPGTPWVHLPITMGYDRYPECLIDEKEKLLGYLLPKSGRLFYTHDPHTALSGIAQDNRGRYKATEQHERLHRLSA